MYQIAICEDEDVFAQDLRGKLEIILDNLRTDYELCLFDSGESLLQAYAEGAGRFDLLFLDVLLDKINGVQAAEKIRQVDQEVAIVFVTAHKDYAISGYGVRAVQYLLKPIDSAMLKALVEKDYEERIQTTYVLVDSGTGKVRVRVAELLYLETVGRKVVVHAKRDTFIFKGKLSELLQSINNSAVVRCHQGYALNVENVKELRGREAITVNGQIVPISRSYQKVVQRVFLRELEH